MMRLLKHDKAKIKKDAKEMDEAIGIDKVRLDEFGVKIREVLMSSKSKAETLEKIVNEIEFKNTTELTFFAMAVGAIGEKLEQREKISMFAHMMAHSKGQGEEEADRTAERISKLVN